MSTKLDGTGKPLMFETAHDEPLFHRHRGSAWDLHLSYLSGCNLVVLGQTGLLGV